MSRSSYKETKRVYVTITAYSLKTKKCEMEHLQLIKYRMTFLHTTQKSL